MALPQNIPWDKASTTWASELNPIINNPTIQTNLIKNISLTSGANIINHGLGRKLQGWYPVRVRSSATFYDTQDSNQTPQLTLTLNSSANVIVDLVVF
jgi:hypothetical protein